MAKELFENEFGEVEMIIGGSRVYYWFNARKRES